MVPDESRIRTNHMHAEFDKDTFKRRREVLSRRMQSGVAIVAAAPMRSRNSDVDYEYRQDSDFFYLTGFEEPDALALLCPTHPEHPFVLFVPKRDKEMEIWHGRRAGREGAMRTFGADAAFELDEMDQKIPDYLKGIDRIYLSFGESTAFQTRVLGWLNQVRRQTYQGVQAPRELHDLSALLHEMRLIKTDDDLRALRRACDITAEAHMMGMRRTRPGKYEYEIQAEIEYVFRTQGALRNGYPSIVAGGNNANILHYVENTSVLNDGDLLLVDAGGEYGMYTGDISRTWPVNGTFTEAQTEVYNWVLKAQLAAIEACRVGESFRGAHDVAVEILTEGLVDMGLLQGNPADIVAAQKQWDEDLKNKKVDPAKDKAPRTYREFYMHSTSHWLGMDVHDVGTYKQGEAWVELQPGHVLTIEPGLYIAAERDDVPERYKGIGVRIEDDVLVTSNGPDVLTQNCPKTIEDIEALMEAARH